MSETTEYIRRSFKSREDDMRRLFTAYESGQELTGEDAEDFGYDDPQEAIDAYALSTDVKRLLTIQISYGGPSEWLEAVVDSDGDVEAAEFHAVWGTDHESTEISKDDALWRYAEQIAGYTVEQLPR